MMLDSIEKKVFDLPKLDVLEKLETISKSFESKLSAEKGIFKNLHTGVEDNFARWLDVDASSIKKIDSSSLFDMAKQMYSGIEIDGKTTRGLKEINAMKRTHPSNIYQQAGFAAEVISTAKENMLAKINDSGIITYRVDDIADKMPELGLKKNDEFVDKIRINTKNNSIEKVQTKFVGKNAEECLSLLTSHKYEKYLDKVDKIEIPKEFYKEITDKNLISKGIENLQKQLDTALEKGKTEAVENLKQRINRFEKIDKMIEASEVTKEDALYATKHPQRYTTKLFMQEITKTGHELGKQSGLGAAAITTAISTVDNIKKVFDGTIEPKDAFKDIATDAGTAGAIGYGTAFVSTAVSDMMFQSSHKLINSLSHAGIPAACISFGVDTYDSVSDYAKGLINGEELSYDLGGSASSITGYMVGEAVASTVIPKVLAGTAAGSIIPGAGTAGGFAVSIVGGMVGCAVASEAYQTAVELGSENAELLLDKTKTYANETINLAQTNIPEKVDTIKAALNDFAKQNELPFAV